MSAEIDFTLQDRVVTTEFEWNPSAAKHKPCCVCGDTENSMICTIEVLKATDDDGKIDLGSDFGQQVVSFLQEKLHHGDSLCNNCYDNICESM